MKKIEIIIPPVTFGDTESDLAKLTEYLVKNGRAEWIGGILGGEFGYGCDYKNKVFEIRPYYWGECNCGFDDKYEREYDKWSKKHKHSKDCYQTLVDNELIENGWKIDKNLGFLCAPKDLTYAQYEKIEDKIRKKYCKKLELTFPDGCAIHCTCDYEKELEKFSDKMGDHKDTCALILPNFKHYKTGLEIRFYKYIGRDMEYNKKVPKKEWKKIFKECINSIDKRR